MRVPSSELMFRSVSGTGAPALQPLGHLGRHRQAGLRRAADDAGIAEHHQKIAERRDRRLAVDQREAKPPAGLRQDRRRRRPTPERKTTKTEIRPKTTVEIRGAPRFCAHRSRVVRSGGRNETSRRCGGAHVGAAAPRGARDAATSYKKRRDRRRLAPPLGASTISFAAQPAKLPMTQKILSVAAEHAIWENMADEKAKKLTAERSLARESEQFDLRALRPGGRRPPVQRHLEAALRLDDPAVVPGGRRQEGAAEVQRRPAEPAGRRAARRVVRRGPRREHARSAGDPRRHAVQATSTTRTRTSRWCTCPRLDVVGPAPPPRRGRRRGAGEDAGELLFFAEQPTFERMIAAKLRVRLGSGGAR